MSERRRDDTRQHDPGGTTLLRGTPAATAGGTMTIDPHTVGSSATSIRCGTTRTGSVLSGRSVLDHLQPRYHPDRQLAVRVAHADGSEWTFKIPGRSVQRRRPVTGRRRRHHRAFWSTRQQSTRCPRSYRQPAPGRRPLSEMDPGGSSWTADGANSRTRSRQLHAIICRRRSPTHQFATEDRGRPAAHIDRRPVQGVQLVKNPSSGVPVQPRGVTAVLRRRRGTGDASRPATAMHLRSRCRGRVVAQRPRSRNRTRVHGPPPSKCARKGVFADKRVRRHCQRRWGPKATSPAFPRARRRSATIRVLELLPSAATARSARHLDAAKALMAKRTDGFESRVRYARRDPLSRRC